MRQDSRPLPPNLSWYTISAKPDEQILAVMSLNAMPAASRRWGQRLRIVNSQCLLSPPVVQDELAVRKPGQGAVGPPPPPSPPPPPPLPPQATQNAAQLKTDRNLANAFMLLVQVWRQPDGLGVFRGVVPWLLGGSEDPWLSVPVFRRVWLCRCYFSSVVQMYGLSSRLT